MVLNITGEADHTIIDNKIGKGNNYRTKAAHLYLKVSEKPEETLYLHGFSGENYSKGKWSAADEEELYTCLLYTSRCV